MREYRSFVFVFFAPTFVIKIFNYDVIICYISKCHLKMAYRAVPSMGAEPYTVNCSAKEVKSKKHLFKR